MNLDEAFAAAGSEGRALLLPYLMAGLPDIESSAELFVAMSDAGADGFEIGIPYADPLMDGPVIQEAGRRALEAGMTMGDGIEVARLVREETGKPCMVMTYVNPVLRVGPEAFAERLASAGVDAVIVADLPVDESSEIAAALQAVGLGLVQFVAPTTSPERLHRVARADPAFVYGIAEMGVTGERDHPGRHAAALAERVRTATDAPLVLGVGISGPDAARQAAAVADGVIVGSALVRRVLEAGSIGEAKEMLTKAVRELAAAVTSRDDGRGRGFTLIP